MKHYLEEIGRVFSALGSSESGLSTADAEERLARDGANRLAEPPKVPLWKKFLVQFADPMIIVLLVAALISFIMAIVEGESLADVFIILFVVILNAILGVVQESKAEKAIDALKEMTKAKCKVLRDGEVHILPSEQLAVGDIILLEAGDAVPADARLIEAASLKAEESALTGESVPSDKFADIILSETGEVPLGDRTNMVYTGTTIVYGRGKAIVVGTGMNTEMGKIAQAITDASEEKTPLQIKLAQLSKILTVAVLGICAIVFAVNLITADKIDAGVLLDTFMVAVSLAVAAIPEGLSAVVTIVLSIGVSKMAAQNAIIRKLTAVETLGCTQLICSDKTGTLTQNKMTVVEHYGNNLELLCCCNSLCNDATVDSEGGVTGEPTEAALQKFALDKGFDRRKLESEQPRIAEAPFDSGRKMMSTLHQVGDKVFQYTKGAPDVVLSRCTKYISDDGKIVELDDSARSEILAQNKSLADKALRVLAAAFTVRESAPEFSSPEDIEQELIFIGLSGMIDPVRPEAVEAIERCRNAGIRAVMITGDHIDTAVAIGKQLGIIEDASQAITGAQLDRISDEQLATDITLYSVYARVQPEHKVRIVNAWKSLGKITAMTGDGVNDAPSIKSADIGVGMGITGTDVTKGVADMILGDDNFATIVNAVEEGRRIYANVRKTIQFLLSSNLSEVITVFTASLIGGLTVFKPIHILWINLITDSLPALGLGMEQAEGDVMSQPPRDSKEGIFAGGLGIDVFWQGACISLLTLASFFIGNLIESGGMLENNGFGTTMAFVTMSMAEIVHSFNLRSRDKSIFKLHSHNKVLWLTMAISFVLTALVIFVPFLKDMFSFEDIKVWEYALALGIGALILPVSEAVKYFKSKK